MGQLDQDASLELPLPCQREVFDYWLSLRAGRMLPSRRDLRPSSLLKRLPTISLVDVQSDVAGEGPAFRFRLFGTGLRDAIGRELTGQTFDGMPDEWASMHSQVLQTRRPAFGFAAMTWRGRPHMVQAWLRLPMADDGETVNMILGYDRFIAVERPAPAPIPAEERAAIRAGAF
jgi:hypothetical protein